MRHRVSKTTLGRERAARQALLRGLATSFILSGKMKTSKAKAKAVRPIVEKMITLGKKNTLHSRRQLMKYLYDEGAVNKVLNDLGPRFKDRQGGYTRIISLGHRQGDGADVAFIEFV